MMAKVCSRDSVYKSSFSGILKEHGSDFWTMGFRDGLSQQRSFTVHGECSQGSSESGFGRWLSRAGSPGGCTLPKVSSAQFVANPSYIERFCERRLWTDPTELTAHSVIMEAEIVLR